LSTKFRFSTCLSCFLFRCKSYWAQLFFIHTTGGERANQRTILQFLSQAQQKLAQINLGRRLPLPVPFSLVPRANQPTTRSQILLPAPNRPIGNSNGEQSTSPTHLLRNRMFCPRVIEFVFKVNDACTNELLSNYIEKKNQNE
jgi:hypothetical protein